jgi:hypothetical protein
MIKHKNPNELHVSPINLKIFTRDGYKGESELSCFASDIGPFRDGRWWLSRLWNDSMDIGICIQSHITGKQQKFYLSHEHCDADGDVTHWTLRPIDKTCKIKLVTIFND